MTLMRVRAAAQLTLPADVRKALNVNEGDYLEAEIVAEGVLLKPVSVVARDRKRQEAWQRIEAVATRVKPRNSGPRDAKAEEEWIAEQVVKSRRPRRKHA